MDPTIRTTLSFVTKTCVSKQIVYLLGGGLIGHNKTRYDNGLDCVFVLDFQNPAENEKMSML